MLFLIAIFSISGAAAQNLPTLKEAEKWFERRGESQVYAQKAADMFEQLASVEEGESMAQNQLLLKMAISLYSLASHKNDHKQIYQKAADIVEPIATRYQNFKDGREEELHATALYWYGISMAKTIVLSTPKGQGP